MEGYCLTSAPSSPTSFIYNGRRSLLVPKQFQSNSYYCYSFLNSNKKSGSRIAPFSVKASKKESFSTKKQALTSNWDVSNASPPSWLPRFEDIDPTTMFLRQRIVFLGTQVDDLSADFVISQLLFLDAEDQEKDIKLFINSPGGSVTAGLGIYDAMKLCKADVSTICFGLAASMGAFLLATGAKGKRFCMPNARVMIHQPRGPVGGDVAEFSIRVRELMYHKTKLNKIFSRVTGKPEKQIDDDTALDNFMSAWEAKEYGLVDEVLGEGMPGWAAPMADASPPPKPDMWRLFTTEMGRPNEALPSEDKLLQNGYIGGSGSDEAEKGKETPTPV